MKDAEIAERMSGNLCGAQSYTQHVGSDRDVADVMPPFSTFRSKKGPAAIASDCRIGGRARGPTFVAGGHQTRDLLHLANRDTSEMVDIGLLT